MKKQMANERKVYFIDNGMRNAVSFQFKEMDGNLLENAVYLQLQRTGSEVFYHQGNKEADFIIKQGLKITQAINVCWDLSDPKTRQREIDSLMEAMDTYNLRKGSIITFDTEDVFKISGKEIKMIPFYKFCLMDQKL
jgi:hypothetical protein